MILDPKLVEKRATGCSIGRIHGVSSMDAETQVARDYVDHAVINYGAGLHLADLKIVVDTAYGAAHFTTPEILRRLGARVLLVNEGPSDGININGRCGSTYPELMQSVVKDMVRTSDWPTMATRTGSSVATRRGSLLMAMNCSPSLPPTGLSRESLTTTPSPPPS